MGDFSGTDVVDRHDPYFRAEDVLFVISLLILIAISTFSTYKGFSYDFPSLLAIAFSVVISGLLFNCNMKLRSNLKERHSNKRVLIMYFIIFVFSGASNINAFYTWFLEKDIAKQTNIIAWNVFDKEMSNIISALEDYPVFKDSKNEKATLEVQLKNLSTQITDLNNPGFGDLAKKQLRSIEQGLGESITRIKPPERGSAEQEYKNYADKLTALINKSFEKKRAGSKEMRLEEFHTGATESRNNNKEKVKELEASKKELATHTDNMNLDLLRFYHEAVSLFQYNGAIPQINTRADNTGSFTYTLQNIVDGINIPALLTSIILALFIDGIMPLYSVLVLRPLDEED